MLYKSCTLCEKGNKLFNSYKIRKMAESKLMREIKFRGWNGKKMLPAESLSQSPNYRKWLGKADVLLLQYTGLKDKNGKEIYEGDIIKQGDDPNCWFSPRVVELKDGAWMGQGIRIYVDQDRFDYEGHPSQNKWEILGNIHEHPELLGAKTEV